MAIRAAFTSAIRAAFAAVPDRAGRVRRGASRSCRRRRSRTRPRRASGCNAPAEASPAEVRAAFQMPGGMGGMMSAGTMSKSGMPTGMSGSRVPAVSQSSRHRWHGRHGHGWRSSATARTPATRRPPEGRSPSAASAALSDPADLSCRPTVVTLPGGADVARRPTSVAVVAVAVAAVSRRPATSRRPPTGAATCRTRWWSRSRPMSRRRPSRRCCAGTASRSSKRSTSSPPARRSCVCASTTGVRCRRWCARWRPKDLDGRSRTSSRRCRKPPRRRQRRCPILSNMRWPGCGCRRRIRSPPATAC